MDRKEHRRKLKTQLKIWKREIGELQIEASAIETEARFFYLKQIEDLRAQRKIARGKLHELAQINGNAWTDLRIGMYKAWGELDAAMKTAIARFK